MVYAVPMKSIRYITGNEAEFSQNSLSLYEIVSCYDGLKDGF